MGASAVSWPRGSGLLVHASLDRREKMWVNGSLEGRCLRSTAGFRKGKYPPRVLVLPAWLVVRKGFDVQVLIWVRTSPRWRAWGPMAVGRWTCRKKLGRVHLRLLAFCLWDRPIRGSLSEQRPAWSVSLQ